MNRDPSPLDSHGRVAEVIEQEMWVQFGVGAFTFVLVMGLLAWIVFVRSRRDPTEAHAQNERGAERWLVLGGIAFPIVALTALLAVSVRSMILLDDPPKQESVILEVWGHRWWWEFNYPVEGISSGNYFAIPVGESVRVRVRSDDVIHSFWPPQLSRKLDAFPGEWTTMWLHADEPGRYRGVCSEFCGLQHARMHFIVDALPPDEYDAWRKHAKRDARDPTTESQRRGKAIFESHSCAYCHTIRGTEAQGEVGPDLTHVGSRPALAGASIPNTRGNLGGWISDPQHVKPGALMPPARLSGPELQAVIDYLESLR